MMSGLGRGENLPSRLARSPFGAEGWKKRRSYWSGLSWRVIWRLNSSWPLVGFSRMCSEFWLDIVKDDFSNVERKESYKGKRMRNDVNKTD